MNRLRVGLLVFNQVEVLDFCGPFEVFATCRLDEERRREEPSPFEPVLIAENYELITTTGGMKVQPAYSLGDCPPLEILIVPGGAGARKEIYNEKLLSWITKTGKQVQTVAGVCTGAMLIGHAGLLEDRRATTHWKSLDWMTFSFPDVQVIRDQHVVEDGPVMTSAGISAGIDLALRIVRKYYGEEVAFNTAQHMEYAYTTDNTRRIAPGAHAIA
jgi:transcriptional regulator GlxA family with amidase domain